MFVVHTDTASGTTSDLAALRRAIDAAGHPALFVVDVVASLAAAPFAMDALGVDVAIGASQKGLMLPPGLAFVAADERALAVARDTPAPRFYWDWARRRSDLNYLKFCGTLPIAHLAGLEAALALIEAEGLAAVHARHARLARAVHAAVNAWGEGGALRVFTRAVEARSASVTAIEVAPGIDPEALAQRRPRALPGRRRRRPGAAARPRLSHRPSRRHERGDAARLPRRRAGGDAASQGIACGQGGVDAAIASLLE